MNKSALNRSADSASLNFNARSFLKKATEHEKLVIGDSLRKMDTTLTPARWRMRTMQERLRDGWASATPVRGYNHHTEYNGHTQDNYQEEQSRANDNLRRANSLMEIPKSPFTIERERMLKKPRQFIISPEWNSEMSGSGKAIISQRDHALLQ